MARVEVTPTNFIDTSRRSLIESALTGLGVGLVGWLLNLAIPRYFIEPVFCRSPDSFAACAQGGTIAWAIALVIVSTIGLLALVKFGVFRPLLVVLAALIALWGASAWLGPLMWWQATLWHGLLFALAYALFSWIARTERFPLAFITIIVLILLLRLVVVRA